jgi:hypothetical protein
MRIRDDSQSNPKAKIIVCGIEIAHKWATYITKFELWAGGSYFWYVHLQSDPGFPFVWSQSHLCKGLSNDRTLRNQDRDTALPL